MKCQSCHSAEVHLLRDFGPHPICNRFLTDPKSQELLHPMRIGQCHACGLVQNIDPVPAAELVPGVEWITYGEPEGHLDAVAETLAALPGLSPGSVFAGVSFKDDTLLSRMATRGFKTWRLTLAEDFKVTRKGCGAETIQARIKPEFSREIVSRRGLADVAITRHIFEHAFDLRSYLKGMHTLVRPGGYVVIEVPDCTLAFDKHDITTLWEEHLVYFTPVTFRRAVTSEPAALVDYQCHPYPFENCLVAITRVPSNTAPEEPGPTALADELARATGFAAAYSETRSRTRSFLENYRKEKGKIALFGAGHLACTWVQLLGLADLIEFVADDNPHKQGLYMPGSRIPIRGSSALATDGVKLALLCASPEAEPKIIARNNAFTEQGGTFASIFPASKRFISHVFGTA
jgi:hypothetical protein